MRERSELDAALRLLDQGRPAEALEALRGLDPGDPDVALCEAHAHLELFDEGACRAALERARAGPAEEDPDWLYLSAELDFRCWRLAEARVAFEALEGLESTPESLDRLARIAELGGDAGAAAGYDRQLAALDPESAPLADSLSDEAFDGVLERAIAALPLVYRETLEGAELVVAPYPERELCAPGQEIETPPDVLGLFVGATQLDRAEDGGHLVPTSMIYVFQRNLERAVSSTLELEEEARITLYHELGHLLGHDEEGVEELGLA
jgi:predicted Zn-dependent protease with MMP-like domain